MAVAMPKILHLPIFGILSPLLRAALLFALFVDLQQVSSQGVVLERAGIPFCVFKVAFRASAKNLDRYLPLIRESLHQPQVYIGRAASSTPSTCSALILRFSLSWSFHHSTP